MKVRKLKSRHKFISSHPMDYVELYINSNLRGKLVSLKDSMKYLVAFKYPELKMLRRLTKRELRKF